MDLKEGEVLCSKCKGSGKECEWVELNYLAGYSFPKEKECSKCFGTGKLDWIENVVGKRQKIDKIKLNYGSQFSFSLMDHHIGSVISNCSS